MTKQPKFDKNVFHDNRALFSLTNLSREDKSVIKRSGKIGSKSFKWFCYLSFSVLFIIVNCKKEETYPIPTFCAAEPDWGPNNVIVFANEPWEIIPPETTFPNDPRPRGLWSIKSDGRELRFLVGITPDGRDFGQCPEWSPDGNWIVANDNIGRIWLVSANGDSFVQITQRGRKWFPSFSPDGRKIAFSTSDSDAVGPTGLRILDLESSTEKFVYRYGTEPSYFPDGSKLLFRGWLQEGNRWVVGLIVVDTSGENAQMVLEEDSAIDAPSFSPDGSKIVFGKPYSYTNDIINIWVVNVDGSNPRKLTTNGGRWPSWSPDAGKIIYSRPGRYEVWRGGSKVLPQEGAGDLYIINSNGSDERRLTFFYQR